MREAQLLGEQVERAVALCGEFGGAFEMLARAVQRLHVARARDEHTLRLRMPARQLEKSFAQTFEAVSRIAATIPTLKFTPGVHVNYAETVLPMKDGLPKLKDFPTELGGSGVAVAE